MNSELYVDGWCMKNVENIETGETTRQDILEGDMEISHIGSEKYLGQIVSSDGRHTLNIEKLKNKGIGLKNKVIKMLESMPPQRFHFIIAIISQNN